VAECLPEGIIFETQAQIDSFQINHPGCTKIEGAVKIINPDITNLDGLSVLTFIGGYLEIYQNTSLTSLTGLDNLTSIGGNLIIGSVDFGGNPVLTSLTGLQGLMFIGGNLQIVNNNNLTNLMDLEGLTTLGGFLWLSNNNALVSLTGLDNIAAGSIDSLYICDNSILSNCAVQSICNYLANPSVTIEIHNNAPGCNGQEEVEVTCEAPCLMEGITFSNQNQIDSFQVNYPFCTEILGNVTIIGGDNITNLNGLSILTSIGGELKFEQNYFLTSLAGLENLTTIGESLSIEYNTVLINLSGLNHVTSIGGGLYVEHNISLTSLFGLDNVTAIGEILWITDNYALSSLTGLGNVAAIGGDIYIGVIEGGNPALTSLTGLESLTSIGGGLYIIDNNFLVSLTGLNKLTAIGYGGMLWVTNNNSLTALAGLDKISAGSITFLRIDENSSLSSCEVKSICEYLANPAGEIYIGDNALGCNSQVEVEAACDSLAVGDQTIESVFSIYPTPTSGIVDCRLSLADPQFVTLKIYDLHGREVATVIEEQLPAGMHMMRFDISSLPPGICFYRLMISRASTSGGADDYRLTTGKLLVK
jgi:hypothetical protein